jgi:FKBP-type peptidyl-prolyl cis-trans isomerase FkpA
MNGVRKTTSRGKRGMLVLATALLSLPACGEKIAEPGPGDHPVMTAEPEVPEPPDLVKVDTVIGTGAEAKDGDKVMVNYTGRLLKTNFMFDTSVGPGKKPFPVTIGKGQVIKGWDLGLVGMKVGGKRKLTIPSKLGYGDKGQPPKIPAKATLVFDVELLSIGDDSDAGAGDAGAADGGKKK